MFATLFGSLARGRLASYVERSDFWTGAEPATPLAEGLCSTTLVATEQGWVAAAALRPGDRVVTFDSGLQTLRAVRTEPLDRSLPPAARPLRVPAGALGNRGALTLLPGQSVLIESDAAEALYGDPFALVPAAALDGWKGIARVAPEDGMACVTLDFDGDEIVYAEGMALIHCPRLTPLIVASAEELILAGSGGQYRALPPAQGRALVAAMGAA